MNLIFQNHFRLENVHLAALLYKEKLELPMCLAELRSHEMVE